MPSGVCTSSCLDQAVEAGGGEGQRAWLPVAGGERRWGCQMEKAGCSGLGEMKGCEYLIISGFRKAPSTLCLQGPVQAEVGAREQASPRAARPVSSFPAHSTGGALGSPWERGL